MTNPIALLVMSMCLSWVHCNEKPSPLACEEKKFQASVELYYESLCPDSLKFVQQQLRPTVKSLGNCANYHLIPWGNAKLKNGSVECQHGEAECLGNAFHACSFSQIPGNLRKVEFVSCYFGHILTEAGDIKEVSKSSKHNVIEAARKCAKEFNLDWTELSTCAEGPVGHGRHLAYGELTSEVNPKVEWVPTTLVYEVNNWGIKNTIKSAFQVKTLELQDKRLNGLYFQVTPKHEKTWLGRRNKMAIGNQQRPVTTE